MTKWKKKNRQAIIRKALQRKLKIEDHGPNQNWGEPICTEKVSSS